MRRTEIQQPSLENCGYPPISTAPMYVANVEEERKKLYAAITSEGAIVLIQNPAVWEEREENGKRYRVRPKPIPYQAPRQMGSRNGGGLDY